MSREPEYDWTPLVHLNGSGGKQLLEGYLEALHALEFAHRVFQCKATCHSRDFYVEDGRWERQWERRIKVSEAFAQIEGYLNQSISDLDRQFNG